MTGAPDIQELLRLSENWPEEAKARVLDMAHRLLEGDLRAWYCTVGRSCNGKPHKGFEYPHARGDQWPPPGTDWFVWFLMGGRGSGKTRTGAEYARRMADRVGRMALIAPTGADVRDTMIEGESGLQMVCAMAGQKLKWEPSKRRITFESGAIATTFSGEEPDRLRGPQFGFAWLDEPAHMPLIDDVWDNLLFGLRLGSRPHITLTSTPLPTKWVKAREAEDDVRVVRVSTYENVDNLAPSFLRKMREKYEGTRKGRQELHGEVLSDVDGALWNVEILQYETVPIGDLERIIVAIDPAGTNSRRSDETGIIVVGVRGRNYYVLADYSGKYSPNGWAERASRAYEEFDADAILAEKNYGGDMVKSTIENTGFDGRVLVVSAMRSKALRAEPVVGKYEQARVFHFPGLAKLEDEMLTWVPGKGDSPNRVDALVWAITELSKESGVAGFATPVGSTLGRKPLRGGFARRRR